jgi:hypothetical protein
MQARAKTISFKKLVGGSDCCPDQALDVSHVRAFRFAYGSANRCPWCDLVSDFVFKMAG